MFAETTFWESFEKNETVLGGVSCWKIGVFLGRSWKFKK
jgi:hypothetical protein